MVAQMKTEQQPIDPVIVALACAMRLQFQEQPAAGRAVDRALEILSAGLPYEFDGVELRVLSYSRANEGIWHVSDGTGCTCEGSRFPWCRHRALFRLLMAQMAIIEPIYLRMRVAEHLGPIEDYPGDFLDSHDEYGDVAPALTEPFRPRIVTHEPAPGSDYARSQAAVDELFAA